MRTLRTTSISGLVTVLILVLVAGFITHAFGAEPDNLTFLSGERSRILLELREKRLVAEKEKAEAEVAMKELEAVRQKLAEIDKEIEKEVEPSKTGDLNFSVGDR